MEADQYQVTEIYVGNYVGPRQINLPTGPIEFLGVNKAAGGGVLLAVKHLSGAQLNPTATPFYIAGAGSDIMLLHPEYIGSMPSDYGNYLYLFKEAAF